MLLTLRAEEHNGRHSYFVHGPYGTSPILSHPPTSGSHLSGVVDDGGDVSQPSKPPNVLLQSKARGLGCSYPYRNHSHTTRLKKSGVQ